MATHAPITPAPGGASLSPRFAFANRAEIEQEIERLIDVLDSDDAPLADLEDDDPSGDPLDMDGESSTDDGTSLLPSHPIYAVDQTRGPVNEREAYRSYRAAEVGLVRSPSGGWRYAN